MAQAWLFNNFAASNSGSIVHSICSIAHFHSGSSALIADVNFSGVVCIDVTLGALPWNVSCPPVTYAIAGCEDAGVGSFIALSSYAGEVVRCHMEWWTSYVWFYFIFVWFYFIFVWFYFIFVWFYFIFVWFYFIFVWFYFIFVWFYFIFVWFYFIFVWFYFIFVWFYFIFVWF